MKYLVEVEVAESIVAEGFKLDDLKARMMVERILPLAHGSQFEARVVPDGAFERLDSAIAELQSERLNRYERKVVDCAVAKFRVDNEHVDYTVTDAHRALAESLLDASIEALVEAREE